MGISTGQPLVLVETSNLPRKDWLAYRRKGIGGSDAAAVLGKDNRPYAQFNRVFRLCPHTKSEVLDQIPYPDKQD